MTVLDTILLGNTIRQWAYAALVALGSLLALQFLLRVAHARAAALAARTATRWDDIVVHAFSRTQALFLPLLCVIAGVATLHLSPAARQVLRTATVLALLLQGGIWLSAGFTLWLQGYLARSMAADRAAATTMTALAFGVKVLLWSIVLLVALDNVGVNVTTLVTGLGVGGIAVALAVQNVLGDLFASLSIVLDKPFVLGDFLVVDDLLGSVEYIGIKTTRLRSLGGEQLVFSNSDLIKSRVRNYGRMAERRVSFEIGVTYQTPRSALQQIPGIVKEAVEAQSHTRFDRSHFKSYGDFALAFETVYYVLSPDYKLYMDIQQAVNLRLHERFEQERIEFAYPTQTLFLERARA